jgi:hypothetical protein
VAALAFGLAFSPGARRAEADIVHLKNGGKVEGKVVSRDAKSLVVKTKVGSVTIDAIDVARVETKATPHDELDRRRKALAPRDADGRVALALWARENGLPKERAALLEEALAIDADHAAANEALGREKVDGKWVSTAEIAALAEEKDSAAKKSSGLVQYGGRWVTSEERDALEKGLKLRDGKWMTEDEIMALDGLVRFKGRFVKKADLPSLEKADALSSQIGVELTAESSENFAIQTAFPRENAEKVLLAAEEAYTLFRRQFSIRDAMWKGRCLIVLLSGRDEFLKYAAQFEKDNGLGPAWLQNAKLGQGYYTFAPPAMVDVKLGRHEDDFVNAAVHKVGHVCINLLHFRTNYVPPWLDEGFAALIEQKVSKRVMNYCFSTGYGSKDRKLEDKWLGSANWYDLVASEVENGTDVPLEQLFTLDWNGLSHREIAKSVAVISFLMEKDAKRFDDFVAKLRDRLPNYEVNATPKEMRNIQSKALFDAFGKSVIEIEKEWRESVKNR